MKILAWNCQGLAKPEAIRAFRLLLSSSKPDIFFLFKIKTPSFSEISKVLFSFSLINDVFAPPIGFAGGLCLAWGNNISINVILQNNFLINALFSSHNLDTSWLLLGIYCPCNPIGRTQFWDLMSTVASSYDGPWLALGYFNSIISQSEKTGGNPCYFFKSQFSW